MNVRNAILLGREADQKEMDNHCQNGCKERGKAEVLNKALIVYLKEFTILPEVATLYLAIIEDIIKTKEGD